MRRRQKSRDICPGSNSPTERSALVRFSHASRFFVRPALPSGERALLRYASPCVMQCDLTPRGRVTVTVTEDKARLPQGRVLQHGKPPQFLRPAFDIA